MCCHRRPGMVSAPYHTIVLYSQVHERPTQYNTIPLRDGVGVDQQHPRVIAVMAEHPDLEKSAHWGRTGHTCSLRATLHTTPARFQFREPEYTLHGRRQLRFGALSSAYTYPNPRLCPLAGRRLCGPAQQCAFSDPTGKLMHEYVQENIRCIHMS